MREELFQIATSVKLLEAFVLYRTLKCPKALKNILDFSLSSGSLRYEELFNLSDFTADAIATHNVCTVNTDFHTDVHKGLYLMYIEKNMLSFLVTFICILQSDLLRKRRVKGL